MGEAPLEEDDVAAQSAAYLDELHKDFRGLHFARRVETQFRDMFASQHLRRMRVGFGVAIGLYTLFTLARVHAEFNVAGAWGLKFRLMALAAMLLTLLASYIPKLKAALPSLTVMAYGVFAASVSAIEVLAHRYGLERHYEGLILVSFHVYVFGGLLFRPALFTGVLVFLAYLAGGGIGGLAGRDWGYQLLFIGLANLIGATALYAIEHVERDSFLRRRLLLLHATRDPLTGLFNRAAFFGQFDRAIRFAARSNVPIAVVLLDIDHFKAYNDRYGHLEGDACLRAVAGALRDSFKRAMDAVGRYGGEEFVGVWYDAPPHALRELAEQLRASVQALKVVHEESPSGRVTVSIGAVACVPQDGESMQVLIQRADKALYAAKEKGRNRVVVDVLPSAANAPRAGGRRAPTVSAG